MDVRVTHRVLVIGAHGVLGALTARAFAEAGWLVRSGARDPRPGDVQIDLGRPESVAAALCEHELVVNTVPHPDLLAERHVLERGGTLINTAALPAAAARSLRAVAGGARGTVLMNAGLAPGVTTLVAAHLLRLHPQATELEIVFTVSLTAARGPASAGFVHSGLTAVERHRTVLVPLPSPFGERRCLGFGEGDAGWLGGIAEGRIVRQYICIAEPETHDRLLEINRGAGMRTLPRSLIDARRDSSGPPPGREPVAHWVAAARAGHRLGSRAVRCRGDFLHAARSTIIFADALRSGRAHGGCFDPEEICTLGEIEGRLRDAGIVIERHHGDPGEGANRRDPDLDDRAPWEHDWP